MKSSKFILLVLVIISTACNKKNGSLWTPEILTRFEENPVECILPDFSYAGYEYGEELIPELESEYSFCVTNFGAFPDDGIEDTEAIQKAVDSLGRIGGGVLSFPPGRFLVNMDSTCAGNIKINFSGIVLKGSGQDSGGTLIYSGNSMHQHQNSSPWLTQFVFHTGLNLFGTDRFYSVDEEPVFSVFTRDMKKGEDLCHLETTEGLEAGKFIMIAMKNTTPDGDLMKELMNPLSFEEFQTSCKNAGFIEASSFQWLVEIEEIIDSTTLRIKQPARRDILTRFQAWVAVVPMLKNIGIENMRFDCARPGGYSHHQSSEDDYGWGAVCMHRVAHGWIRNLSIHNYTQTTHLVNSRNVNISNITITGSNGHYGPKLYCSSDNLITDIMVLAPRTHGPGLEGASFGNVFKDIYLEYPQPLDLHGLAEPRLCPPMYNLYEDISMTTSVAGGAAPGNTPHAGEYNTFWNIEMTGFEDDGYQEIFYSWIWRNPEKFKNEFHIDCHKQYLRSIMVGVYHDENELSIEHSKKNRQDEYIYTEGLNRKNVVGLYESQLRIRLENL